MTSVKQVIGMPEQKILTAERMRSPKTGATIKMGKGGGQFVAFARDFNAATPMKKVEVIRRGVSPKLVIEASAYFGSKPSDIGRLLGMSPSTTERRLKAGGKLTQTESERLARLAIMESEAAEVFGSEEKAKRWLTNDHKKLGAVPLSLLDTEIGANEVRKVLMAIAHGLAA